jgi:g-D-glutamyl-meso-diaminopimelate peptidase
MYSYQNLLTDLDKLRSLPDIEIFSIGKSVMGKEIPCIRVGSGRVRVQINAAHHAIESITSALSIRFCRLLATASRETPYGYDIEHILHHTVYYVVPMVNPDGVELASGELNKESIWYKRLCNDLGSVRFAEEWSANINGVDLNHNYDAGFLEQKDVLREQGIFYPGSTRYPGESAFDQPESRALGEFTAKNGFDLLICLHSQGKEIYYDYNGTVPPGGKELSEHFVEVSGYQLSQPDRCACFGGCKDWFIEKFHKPAFTIEVGLGKNPLPEEMLPQIEEECFPILLKAGLYTPEAAVIKQIEQAYPFNKEGT